MKDTKILSTQARMRMAGIILDGDLDLLCKPNHLAMVAEVAPGTARKYLELLRYEQIIQPWCWECDGTEYTVIDVLDGTGSVLMVAGPYWDFFVEEYALATHSPSSLID